MSNANTELRQGSTRTAVTELDGREPKRAKRDEVPTTISPSRPSPTSSMMNGADQAMICQLCKAKKVDEAFLDVLENRKTWTKIPSRMRQPLEESCQTCRLLLHARERKSKSYEDRNATYFYRFTKTGTPSTPVERVEAFRLAAPKSKPLRFSVRKPQKGHIPDATKFKQSLDNSERLNFPLFTEQIRICQETHKQCQLQYPKVVHGLKVIDCRTRKVIQAQPDCAYVALSYVWGSGKAGDLQDPPKTIADALSATLNLGLNYLWIDRYCIDQQDDRDKHTQIQQMGSIYRQAQVTIIAAVGDDPSHGLPGVSSNRPSKNPILLNHHMLYPMHQTSNELISFSTWMSRAWTYQEFVLSRRRLVFTDQHAFLHCPTTMTEEWPASAWKTTYVPNSRIGKDMGCNLQDSLTFAPYHTGMSRFSVTVRQYSKRRLTFASDTLNGILGVLSTFEEQETPMYHLHGLPYHFNETSSKLWLYWSASPIVSPTTWPPESVPQRKLEQPGDTSNQPVYFPSWSWTAWEAFPSFHDWSGWGPDETSTKISVELMNSDEKLPLEEYASRRKSGEDITASPFIWVDGWTLPVELRLDLRYEMIVTDSRSKKMHMVCKNTPFTREDVLSGKRQVQSLIALVLSFRRGSIDALILEEHRTGEYRTHEYRRIGIGSDHLYAPGLSFEPLTASAFMDGFGVIQRSIRIG